MIVVQTQEKWAEVLDTLVYHTEFVHDYMGVRGINPQLCGLLNTFSDVHSNLGEEPNPSIFHECQRVTIQT